MLTPPVPVKISRAERYASLCPSLPPFVASHSSTLAPGLRLEASTVSMWAVIQVGKMEPVALRQSLQWSVNVYGRSIGASLDLGSEGSKAEGLERGW